MKTISRYIMTLALLLTAVTGAWAQSYEAKVFDVPASWTGDETHLSAADLPKDFVQITKEEAKALAVPDGIVLLVYGFNGENVKALIFMNGTLAQEDEAPEVRGMFVQYQASAKICYTAEAGPKVAWDAATKTGTFAMPGSDVVLTPIYSEATITRGGDTPSETAYASLKEAFAAVQDGDVIKLDWNVTLTEDLATPTIDGGVEFTLDFNGYTLDGGTTYRIQLKNASDQLTFTDSSVDQLGGLIAKGFNNEDGGKFVFDAGRYNLNGVTAEILNGVCAIAGSPLSLPEGKEFVDIEGAPVDGFMVRVAYKAFELTIGAGKFATFYMDQNITLADGTDANIGLYTINGEGINRDNNTVTVTKVNGPIAIAGMPLLVYNGTTEQKTVTLKVTPDQPTAGQMWSTHFQGTAVDKTFDADDMAANDYYVLSGGKAFAPVRGTGTIAKNKCWLEFAKQEIPSAHQLTIVFDETTGIEAIDNGQLTIDNYYDLNGRKLNAKPTRKGVYIKNGQKKVVK